MIVPRRQRAVTWSYVWQVERDFFLEIFYHTLPRRRGAVASNVALIWRMCQLSIHAVSGLKDAVPAAGLLICGGDYRVVFGRSWHGENLT
jgi:hypothetical protein